MRSRSASEELSSMQIQRRIRWWSVQCRRNDRTVLSNSSYRLHAVIVSVTDSVSMAAGDCVRVDGMSVIDAAWAAEISFASHGVRFRIRTNAPAALPRGD